MSVRPSLLTATLTFVLLGAVLSGCLGKGSGDDTVDDPFDDETGAIQGLLVNEEELPIPSAQVGLEGSDARTTTDAVGAFMFSNIAPGSYRIEAQSIGFERGSQDVEVRAGEITEVTLRLQTAALPGLPYTVTLGPLQGKFFCAVGSAVAAGPCKLVGFGGVLQPAEDGYQDVAQGEENIFNFPTTVADNKTRPEDAFRSLVAEVQWVPSSGASTTMQMTVERYGDREVSADDPDATEDPLEYANVEGTSPIHAILHAGQTHTTGQAEFPADVEGFTIGVFPAFTEAPQAFTEQRFEVWITLFYNQPAPDAYTVLPDE